MALVQHSMVEIPLRPNAKSSGMILMFPLVENRELIFVFLPVQAAIITVWVRPQKRRNPFDVVESC